MHCYLFAWRYYPFSPFLFLILHYIVAPTAREFLLTCKRDITPKEAEPVCACWDSSYYRKTQ